MLLFSKLWDVGRDFLFPKSEKVLELENLSTEELFDTLPKAEPCENKDSLAIFDYDHPVTKELIWELKYGGNRRIAEKLGKALYEFILQELGKRHPDRKRQEVLLIPIPISGRKRLERGWNQSELLAKAILKNDTENLFRYVPGQLVKIAHTESQTKTTSRRERLENLDKSMRATCSRSKDALIVVIDDVTTTGATFNEARRAIKAVGDGKVLCFAVAH